MGKVLDSGIEGLGGQGYEPLIVVSLGFISSYHKIVMENAKEDVREIPKVMHLGEDNFISIAL